MSHLAKALALSVVLSCSGSKPAEPPAEVPTAEPAAAEPAEASPEATVSTEATEATVSTEATASAEPAAPTPAEQGVTKTLFVAATLADCQGEAAQKCLQVRESESEPYRNLYAPIAGFDYQPSYEYELRVEATPVPHPPADASAVQYRLIEVVAKRKAAAAKPD